MNTLKRYLLIAFIPVLFAGTVGVDVFKHICSKDGISVSYIVNTIDHCDQEPEELPTCCKKDHHQESKDCCDDEVEHFQLKFDFFQGQQDLAFTSVFLVPQPLWQYEISAAEPELIASNYYPDPPPLSRHTRLALNQVYII